MLSVCGFISAAAETATKMEAESATYENCKLIEDGKYSEGKALELTESNAKITFTYAAAESGKYTITVGYDGLYGDKEVYLTVPASSVRSMRPAAAGSGGEQTVVPTTPSSIS